MISNADIVSLIAPDVESFETLATHFAKNRFLALSAEFDDNEKEAAEIEKIADRIKCVIQASGSEFELRILVEEGSGDYFEIVDQGMEAPLAGGSGGGGIAKNPDGSTYRSKVPPALWGTKLDELAKQGLDVMSEIKSMLTGLMRDSIQEAVQSAKPKIADMMKAELVHQLQL